MSDDKNCPPGNPLHKHSGSALFLTRTSSNPLTVFALCNYLALLTSGILQLEELQHSPIEDFPAEVFMELLDSYPGLLDRLMNGEEEDIIHVGELLGKGASCARRDNTKTLKSAILKWLLPRGQPVIPPFSRNIKSDCGFNHELTGALLCPAGLNWSNSDTKQSLKSGETAVRGDQWPMCLYAGYVYDPEDPWKGLLRSEILIFGFKHVFMSPSSVERELKAMRSSNAYLHSMKCVQLPLSSSSVFSCTDTVTDSENFYHSILDILEYPDENKEVVELMMWWTCCIFPIFSSAQCGISKNSVLLKIREKCAALQATVGVN
ncbi:hypothetical protein BDR07DRAFT_1454911 [Suillus spraguei]|nr:hypothetical protein BDR07DRAFT_1454911 [Suillus spraguei]